jgi:hypothetical protein
MRFVVSHAVSSGRASQKTERVHSPGMVLKLESSREKRGGGFGGEGKPPPLA